MSKNNNRKELKGKHALAVFLAAINGLNSATPLALPLIAAAADTYQNQRQMEKNVLLTSLQNGGQLLDKLFFVTASAAVVPVSDGQTINNGETQSISGAKTVKDTTINNGGSQTVAGSSATAENTTINNGGRQKIDDGATATSTTINSGGMQLTTAGIAINTTINGGKQMVDGPSSRAENTTINNGGLQELLQNSNAIFTTINNGGVQIVSNDIGSGATAKNTTINAGGKQQVKNKGIAEATTVGSGGLQYVCASGTASNTTINSGGEMRLEKDAGVTGTTTINSGTVSLIGTSGDNYTIENLNSSNGTIYLSYGLIAGRNLTVNNLSGSANFIINTDLKNGQSDNITISNTTGSSHNTVRVKYDPGYLTGQTVAGTAAFATVPGSSTTFTAVSTDNGAYSYTPTLAVSPDAKTWTITGLTAGASETVYTGSDILGGNLALWRSENNTLSKRMGEIRDGQGQAGDWLRIYRGKQELNAQNGRSSTQQYIAVQGGYDTKHVTADGSWHTGYTVGYFTADTDLTRGSGEASSLTVGAYGTWLGSSGHYLDIITKQGRLRNNYDCYLNNSANTKVNGDYDNWGTSLSVEYGYRKQLKAGWYLEPQAEINLSRISGADYSTSDSTSVHNQSVNSLIGRLGVAIGRKQNQNSYYLRTSIAREFSANSRVSMASGGLAPITMEQNLKETWLEFALGLTSAFTNKSSGYLEISKTTGDRIKTPWQVNAGVRWNF